MARAVVLGRLAMMYRSVAVLTAFSVVSNGIVSGLGMFDRYKASLVIGLVHSGIVDSWLLAMFRPLSAANWTL